MTSPCRQPADRDPYLPSLPQLHESDIASMILTVLLVAAGVGVALWINLGRPSDSEPPAPPLPDTQCMNRRAV